jgi:peptide/nickel transport system substrate-binding protein
MRPIGFMIVAAAMCTVTACTGPDTDTQQSGTSSDCPPKHSSKIPPKPVTGDTIVIGSIQDATTLLPVLAPDMPSRRVTRLIYNGLVKYDKNVRLAPDLAERWVISPDRKTIRFRLRKGVKWHDGKPFTAQDVQYTYQVYVDPKTPTPYASDFLRIKDLRVIDDLTVEAEYERPYAPGLGSWSEPMLPRHLLEGTDITESPLARSPVGTGPYRFVSWDEGEKIVLEANPDYFAGRPYIDNVVIRFLLDKATAFLELKAGDVDRMSLTPLQYARQTDRSWFTDNFCKYKYLSFSYTYLAYNLQDWKFKDKRVRQALTMAIDRNGIIQAVLLGQGQVVHAPYNPSTYWYNHKVKKWPYSPKKAKKLLAAAGWKDSDGDGILDKDGMSFELTIFTNQGDDRRKNAATIIQSNLKQVGVKVEVRIIEWAALLHHFLYKRNFEACIIGWALDYDPNQYDKWSSKKTGPFDFNWMHYQNPEADKLLERGVSTFDPKERKKIYDKLQQILSEDQPCTFLWAGDALSVVHSRFYGIKPAPIGIDYNFEKWHVPLPLQYYVTDPTSTEGEM